MQPTPLISIIIPVYNTEKYLRECVGSILSQDFCDYELILVNDGSTDGSGVICDDYAARDSRVIVLHQQNAGASVARNAGLKLSRGGFILFVDSDDTIVAGSLRKIAENAKTDVIFLRADKGRRRWSYAYDNRRLFGKSRAEALRYLARVSRFPVSPAVKLLRRKFLLQNDIKFTEGIICEDVDHMIQVLLAAQSFSSCDFPYYIARRREGSVMTSRSGALHRFNSTLYIIRKWRKYAKGNPQDRAIIRAILRVQYVYLVIVLGIITLVRGRFRGPDS